MTLLPRLHVIFTVLIPFLFTGTALPPASHAATRDQIVPYHPRLLHQGESGWDRHSIGSFAWRIMKDLPGTPPPPIAPATDSMYWEFRYAHTGIDFGADFMFRSGDYYTYSSQILNPLMAAKAMQLGWNSDIPSSGLPYSSGVYNPAHTADEYFEDTRTKLLWLLDRDQPIDAFYNVRFGSIAYDWLYTCTNSSGKPILSVQDKQLVARRLLENAEFIKANYTRPNTDELFRTTHLAHYLYVLVGFAVYESTTPSNPEMAALNSRAAQLLDDYDAYWVGSILPALQAQGGGAWHGGMGNLNPELDYYHPENDVAPWHLAPILYLFNTALGRDTAEPPYALLRNGIEFQVHMFQPSNLKVQGNYFALGLSSPETTSRTSWVWPQFMSAGRRFSPQPHEQQLAELAGWLRLYKSEGFIGGGSWDMIYQMLWKDKFPNPRSPELIGFPTVRHFAPLGWVSMREGFDSTNQLASLFFSQSKRWSHLDLPAQNGFIIHYKTPLLPKADRNTLKIGGTFQTSPSSFPKVSDGTNGYSTQSTWDVGPGIIRHEDNPIFSYTLGDASHAYPSNLLNHFTRHLVYLKGSKTFVIFDHVITTSSDVDQSWNLAPSTQPIIIGPGFHRIDNGPASLWIKRFLPDSSATTTITSAEFAVTPNIRTNEVFYLHVLEATDSGTPVDSLSSNNAIFTTRDGWFDITLGTNTFSFSQQDSFQWNTNSLPIASIQSLPATTTELPQNKNVTFDASTSRDPDGSIVSYEWDFQDGTRITGARVTHAFEHPGLYSVQLRIIDNRGAQSTQMLEVNVVRSTPPKVSLSIALNPADRVEIRWPSNSETQAYTLESASTLVSPTWNKVSIAPLAAEGQKLISLPRSAESMYFRLFKP